jgi:hypothetical protein
MADHTDDAQAVAEISEEMLIDGPQVADVTCELEKPKDTLAITD